MLPAVGLLFVGLLAVPAAGQEARPLQPSEPRVELIPLKVGDAVVFARLLNEVFSGSEKTPEVRIVVMAVPLTNWLLAKASAAELLLIRELVRPR
jgi:hypothetical protein